MATNRPKMGRPRRREGIKRLKLRELTFNLWNERKEALGLRRITNSEFAEMLLHQHFSARQERARSHPGSHHGRGSPHSTPSTPRRGKKMFLTCYQ